jgi:hypothetical protein
MRPFFPGPVSFLVGGECSSGYTVGDSEMPKSGFAHFRKPYMIKEVKTLV